MDKAPEDPSPEGTEPDPPAAEQEPAQPAEAPAYESYAPPVPPVPPGQVQDPSTPPYVVQGEFAAPIPDQEKRPGVGPGVATGCGLQVLGFILFFVTAGIIPFAFGGLWPFILFTIGSAVLLFSKRWRRFATGALIVCAATWIVVIGPCAAMLGGFGTV